MCCNYFSEPANGRDPQTVARDLLKKKVPPRRQDRLRDPPQRDGRLSTGYGEVADTWPQGGTSNSYIRLRTVLLVAIKNDLALVAGAVGPYHAFGPISAPASRQVPICRSPKTWANTSTALPGRVTRRAEVLQPQPNSCSRPSSMPKWCAISWITVIATSSTTSASVSHMSSSGSR